MARTKTFDPATAVASALDVFWRRGYERASTAELLDEMGIGRQSLYDSFGDKKQLYLRSLERYCELRVVGIMEALREHRSPLAALRSLLHEPARLSSQKRSLGCLGVNAVCEFGVDDAEVLSALHANSVAVGAALDRLVADARSCGEISSRRSDESLVRFLASTLAGIQLSARGGAPPQVLRDIADVALDAISRPRGNADHAVKKRAGR